MGENRKIKGVVGLALIAIILIFTGCSNQSNKATSASNRSSGNNSTSTKNASTEPISNDSTNSKQGNNQIGADDNSIELKETKGNGGSVLVPVGWVRTSDDGGDYTGYLYKNPKDPNQKMEVVTSVCTGCFYHNSDSNKKPDPKLVIPETDVQSTYIFGNGYDVAYSYYQNGNPYLGNGVLKIRPEDGYGFAEITLPASEKSIATKILNSYQF